MYENAVLFQRVKQALLTYPNVVLLLPFSNLDESAQILNRRNEYVLDSKVNINEHFVKHNSNYKLAKFTVYIKNKTPKETCYEILKTINKI